MGARAGFIKTCARGQKGTCRFVQGVPTGARRAILTQKENNSETRRSQNPTEVGALH
jgi:hypothetical protein